MSLEQLWKVAVDAPLPEALTYNFSGPVQRGQLVNVPLGRRKAKGLVMGATNIVPDFEIKNIDSIDDEYAALPEPFIKWLEWLSLYYLHPVGQVVQSAFPPLRRKEKSANLNVRLSFRS